MGRERDGRVRVADREKEVSQDEVSRGRDDLRRDGAKRILTVDGARDGPRLDGDERGKDHGLLLRQVSERSARDLERKAVATPAESPRDSLQSDEHAEGAEDIGAPGDPHHALDLRRVEREDQSAHERAARGARPAPQGDERERRRGRVSEQVRDVKHERASLAEPPVERERGEDGGTPEGQIDLARAVVEVRLPERPQPPMPPMREIVDEAIAGDERAVVVDPRAVYRQEERAHGKHDHEHREEFWADRALGVVGVVHQGLRL